MTPITALSLVPQDVPDGGTPDASTPDPAGGTLKDRGLTSHVGSFEVDLEAVAAVNTPPPGGSFQPVAHIDLYRRIRSELALAEIAVGEEMHALYRGGDRYIGLAVTNLRSPDNDAEVVVGWFNSHDKSHAATLLLGERVMVCFNLCLHAEIKVCRRHTKHIRRDLPGLVAGAVDQVRRRVSAHGQRMDAYRSTPLPVPTAHHVLVQMVDDGALTPGQLKPVLRQWREPEHPEFAQSWNVYRLYQAVTAQSTPLSEMASRHRRLHHHLDELCGLAS